MNRAALTTKYETLSQSTRAETALRNASKDVYPLLASRMSDEEVLAQLANFIAYWNEAAVQHGDLPDTEYGTYRSYACARIAALEQARDEFRSGTDR